MYSIPFKHIAILFLFSESTVAPAAVATLIVLSVELLEIIISLTEFGISLITCAIAFLLHYKQE
jgi:hypothetical protein